MSVQDTACDCGCSTMTQVTKATEPCTCGCACCDSSHASHDQEVAELKALRESVERRLSDLGAV